MITQLLYTSTSRYPRGHQTDFAILQEAMSHNPELDVTGYLLRDVTSFCQVIEGPTANVELLFRRIARDPRHHEVVLRMRRAVPGRGFLGWSMGYASLNPRDSQFLSGCFAEGRKGVILAFDRIGRVAAAQG